MRHRPFPERTAAASSGCRPRPSTVTAEYPPADPERRTRPSRSCSGSCPSPLRRTAASPRWALAFSIAGLLVSLFVGWGFPIGLVGVVSAILALRRPLESRAVAVWALVLGAVSVLYSAGWLLYAASRVNLFG